MKKLILMLALSCPLFAPLALFAQTTTVTGTKVLNGSGGLLASGQWCLGATCFNVTNGVIAPASSVTSATATVKVVNGSTTYLTVYNVAVTGTAFNWDGFVLTGAADGVGAPRIAGALGATYAQTDAGNLAWSIISQNGQLIWSTANGGSASARTSGLYAGTGTPNFSCISPCQYTQTDAAAPNLASWSIVALPGTASTNWVNQAVTVSPWLHTAYATIASGTFPVGVERILVLVGTVFYLPRIDPGTILNDPGDGSANFTLPTIYITNQTASSITINVQDGDSFWIGGSFSFVQTIAAYTTVGYVYYTDSTGDTYWEKIQ